jgi:hypothetical protein
MSAPRLYVVPSIGTTGLSGTTVPWCLKLNSRAFTLVQIGFSLGGAAPGTGLLVQLVAVLGGLPGSGNPATPGKLGDQSMAAATTTAEVGGTVIGTPACNGPAWYVQPFGGVIDVEYPLHREAGFDAAAPGYWALAVYNGTVAYPYASYAVFEEH